MHSNILSMVEVLVGPPKVKYVYNSYYPYPTKTSRWMLLNFVCVCCRRDLIFAIFCI